MTGGGSHRLPENPKAAAGGEIPLSIVIAVSLVTIVFISAVTILVVLEKPVDNLMLIVGAYLAPTVGTLLASKKLGTQNRVLEDVRNKVDEKVDNLITDKAILENQVTHLGDVPATLPTRRATDTAPQSAYPPRTTEIPKHGR